MTNSARLTSSRLISFVLSRARLIFRFEESTPSLRGADDDDDDDDGGDEQALVPAGAERGEIQLSEGYLMVMYQ